jgi:hypothetical protein
LSRFEEPGKGKEKVNASVGPAAASRAAARSAAVRCLTIIARLRSLAADACPRT